MKTLIVILIFAAFLQTTIIPIDLVLLILIVRSYLKSDRANLYLAFVFGLLAGHLGLTSPGLTALSYLVSVSLAQGLSRLRMAGNPLGVVPVVFVLLSAQMFITSYAARQTPQFPMVVFASLLSLPILYLLRLWEERFIAEKDIRLKIK